MDDVVYRLSWEHVERASQYAALCSISRPPLFCVIAWQGNRDSTNMMAPDERVELVPNRLRWPVMIARVCLAKKLNFVLFAHDRCQKR